MLINAYSNMATSSDKDYGVLVLLPLSLMVATVMMARVSEAATIEIKNQCRYTVWPAAIPGGGTRLDRGQSWRIQVAAGTAAARIWGRTGCNFDSSGRGHCVTGDCGGLLRCTGSGAVPSTLVEYSLNQFSNKDFYDISLVDGFNIPVSIVPLKGGCSTVTCLADINSKCPSELKVRDGCKSACVAFNTPRYCCTGQYLNNCPPTDYSRFFKRQCPQAYSYAKDDPSSTFTCAGGGDYKVVFCGTSLGSSDVYNTTSSLVESQ